MTGVQTCALPIYPVFFVGSATGKDGIGGASFASADITAESAEELPAVQVGDPFQEKKLLEACLEVIKTGAVGVCRTWVLQASSVPPPK